MYALSLKEGKASNLDKDDESDNDSEVLGQVVRKIVLGKPISLVDVGEVETKIGENNDNEVEEVVAVSLESWNPFNSVEAPEGYCFLGDFAFLCYGPASDYFPKALSRKGS